MSQESIKILQIMILFGQIITKEVPAALNLLCGSNSKRHCGTLSVFSSSFLCSYVLRGRTDVLQSSLDAFEAEIITF